MEYVMKIVKSVYVMKDGQGMHVSFKHAKIIALISKIIYLKSIKNK